MQEKDITELKDEYKKLPLRKALHRRINVAAAKAEMSMNDYLDSIVPKE